ncbi:MAG: drug/metabolite exporter YedA [Acidobacteriaceae bacterium]
MAAPDFSKARIASAFACVYLCWGMTYGAIHIAVEHLAPPLVGAFRSLLSTTIFIVICLARGISLRVSRATAWKLALVGVLIMSVNNVLLVWAESLVASGWASVVISMVPIFVALLETVLPNGETLSARGWLGTILAAAGILALLWPSLHGMAAGGHSTGDLRTLAGFVILVVAALAFAVGSVLGRRFRFQLNTFVATAWQIGAAGLVNLVVATGGGTLRTAHFTREGLLAICFLSVFGSVVGLTAYTYLLQHVPVTKVSTYAFINPVIAVLIGVAAFHERLGASEVVGMVVILAGVATVILSRTASAPLDSDPEFAA